jgi:hypothetical protein
VVVSQLVVDEVPKIDIIARKPSLLMSWVSPPITYGGRDVAGGELKLSGTFQPLGEIRKIWKTFLLVRKDSMGWGFLFSRAALLIISVQAVRPWCWTDVMRPTAPASSQKWM